jgi:hypothetical protein
MNTDNPAWAERVTTYTASLRSVSDAARIFAEFAPEDVELELAEVEPTEPWRDPSRERVRAAIDDLNDAADRHLQSSRAVAEYFEESRESLIGDPQAQVIMNELACLDLQVACILLSATLGDQDTSPTAAVLSGDLDLDFIAADLLQAPEGSPIDDDVEQSTQRVYVDAGKCGLDLVRASQLRFDDVAMHLGSVTHDGVMVALDQARGHAGWIVRKVTRPAFDFIKEHTRKIALTIPDDEGTRNELTQHFLEKFWEFSIDGLMARLAYSVAQPLVVQPWRDWLRADHPSATAQERARGTVWRAEGVAKDQLKWVHTTLPYYSLLRKLFVLVFHVAAVAVLSIVTALAGLWIAWACWRFTIQARGAATTVAS